MLALVLAFILPDTEICFDYMLLSHLYPKEIKTSTFAKGKPVNATECS